MDFAPKWTPRNYIIMLCLQFDTGFIDVLIHVI
jgi:hypothetical protein